MHGSARRPMIVISGGGSGVVSHAGSRLLAELADRSGVTGGFADVLAGLRRRLPPLTPGRCRRSPPTTASFVNRARSTTRQLIRKVG